MNSRSRWIGITGLAVLGMGILLAARPSRWAPALPSRPSPAGPPAILFPAPDFRLRSFGGPLIALSSLRGKVVVLNFWASWCLPCREEMPNLERAWREFQRHGMTVLGLNVADDYDEGATFLKQLKITYPNLYDPDQTRLNSYRVTALPATIFIDTQMRVRSRVDGGYIGAEGYERLRQQILALLQ